MEQQLKLIQKTLLPSQILRKAYFDGVKKIERELRNDDGVCAVGAILGADKSSMDIQVMYIFSEILYGDRQAFLKDEDKYTQVDAITLNLMRLNDQGPHVTFLDCANYLESKGL